jgi:hypothetical protein
MIAALAAAAASCESNALRPLGGSGGGGWSSRPLARDAGAADAKSDAKGLVADASPDHQILDVTPAPLGAACTGSAACLSGFCVEGICCTTACAGGCQTCSAPGTVGSCVERAAGSECMPGVCANGSIIGTSLCDGQGVCRAGPAIICAPYGCDPVTNQCEASCQSDSDCLGGRPCHNGVCGDPYRDPCLTNEECASGFCTDGVCCNSACAGPCLSCALPGHVGACTAVGVGTVDPHAACVDQGPASCGQDGTCDGQGGCSLYPAGVICAASSCSGTLWSGAGVCSGTGTCQRETRPCLPYACDPQTNSCHSACASADDCGAGNPCVNGSCGYPEPAYCSTDAECASGFCAQGVCCTTRCDGPCFSCALPGTPGTCTPVPNPSDAGSCAP